jgi:hypothetical protein
LIAYFLARLRDEDPSGTTLPLRPEKVEKWELTAALSIALEQMRIEFASMGFRATCDPDLRKRLDAGIDAALTRLEAAADRI